MAVPRGGRAEEGKAPKEGGKTDFPWETVGKNLEKLVALLGHEDWKIRSEAERRLDALDEKSLPALRKAGTAEDPEIRMRAQRLLKTIENRVQRRKLKLILSAAKTAYKSGETISLSAVFRNTNTEPVVVCRAIDGSTYCRRHPYYFYEVRRVVRDGEKEKEIPIKTIYHKGCGNMNFLRAEDLKELKPNGTFKVEGWFPSNLTHFHNLKEPGTYRVTLIYVLDRKGVFSPMPCGQAPRGEDRILRDVLLAKALEGTIRSNTLTIEVK
jgi:vacuolar-type H+-ATPase subunit H